jgi:hypothetical protein
LTVTTCGTFAEQRIEINRQRRDERFAFTGPHLSNHSAVQHHPADHLNIEMAHTGRPNRGFAHARECFGQQLIERFLFQ